jgi:hypothetical protein
LAHPTWLPAWHDTPLHSSWQPATHVPASQLASSEHEPHSPPHPLGPHSLPAQLGAHSDLHTPAEQVGAAAGHAPHWPPHPSSPHSLPVHCGTQAVQTPSTGKHSPTSMQLFDFLQSEVLVALQPPPCAVHRPASEQASDP